MVPVLQGASAPVDKLDSPLLGSAVLVFRDAWASTVD